MFPVPANIRLGEDVLKTPWWRIEDVFFVTFFWLLRRFQYITARHILKNILKIWRSRLRRRKIVSLETFSNYVRSGHEKIPMTCSDICLYPVTEQWSQRQINLEFFFKDFFGKCDPIGSFLRIQSHLLKKSLMENFIFHAVEVTLTILLNTTSQTPI